MNTLCMDSPAGPLTLVEEDGALTGIRFEASEGNCESPLLMKTRDELNEYFSGQRRVFDIPLLLKGTAFRRQCWQALCRIPYGETRTYGQQAEAIGNPKAARAVGGANHHNPIPIIVPCHRIIGADGSLTGYAGGMEIKRILLELEGAIQQ